MKAFAKDLKTIYTAANEESARKQLEAVTRKWSGQYPSAMNRWNDNWDAISPIFKFSKEVRTAFYTTNAIESLNSCYRRLNKQRSVFPSSQALMKALYLGTFEIAKKWTMPIRNWGKVRGELEIMYPDRLIYLHHAGQHGVHPFLLRPVNLQQVRVQLSLKIRLLQRPADVLSSIIAFI